MDRSNISFIAPQMMEDLHMTKQQFGLLASFFHHNNAIEIILRGPNFSANIPEGTCINA
jgi:sugar phosphate permease